MHIEGDSGASMTPIVTTTMLAVGGFITSHLPELNEWVRLVSGILTALAALVSLALGIRKWLLTRGRKH